MSTEGVQDITSTRSRWRRPRGIALWAAGFLVLVGTAAVFAPALSWHEPNAVLLESRLLPPVWADGGTWSYPLGTDGLGRDVWTRLVYGARMTFAVATAVILISGAIGIVLGMVAGYFGGWLDSVIGRLIDTQLAFPNLLLAIAIVASMGSSTFNVILALSVAAWVPYARVVRAATLRVRQVEFVTAVRVLGLSPARILARHVAPNVASVAVVMASFGAVSAILAESSLSFLGLGAGPSSPTWGSVLSDGREYLRTAWWVTAFPGLAIALTVLSINMLGDWLRDVFDPSIRA